jgi:DNA polymerase-3 subunit gamma/tau
MDVAINQEVLPKDAFSQAQLIASWDSYVESLEVKGRYNLAAILKIDIPTLKEDSLIALEFPNSTNKIEVERQQTELLQFLRKSLNNFDIKLDITVNESMEKEFAYTVEEKFAKLKAKNPTIETLKKTFNLDL